MQYPMFQLLRQRFPEDTLFGILLFVFFISKWLDGSFYCMRFTALLFMLVLWYCFQNNYQCHFKFSLKNDTNLMLFDHTVHQTFSLLFHIFSSLWGKYTFDECICNYGHPKIQNKTKYIVCDSPNGDWSDVFSVVCCCSNCFWQLDVVAILDWINRTIRSRETKGRSDVVVVFDCWNHC